jgi:hypothetical protein
MSLPLGKKLLAVGMLSLSLNQVYAEGIQLSVSQPDIASSDVQALFEQEPSQLQIAQLTASEMAETYGAFSLSSLWSSVTSIFSPPTTTAGRVVTGVGAVAATVGAVALMVTGVGEAAAGVAAAAEAASAAAAAAEETVALVAPIARRGAVSFLEDVAAAGARSRTVSPELTITRIAPGNRVTFSNFVQTFNIENRYRQYHLGMNRWKLAPIPENSRLRYF